MSQDQHDEHDAQLSVLLADLFASDERDLELLVRYAEDVSSRSPAECASVEARLSADPSWKDRLRVLQNFDPAAVSTESETEVESDPSIAPVVLLERYRGSRLAAWAAVAAAAAWVLWLNLPSDRTSGIPALPDAVVSVPTESEAPAVVVDEIPARESVMPVEQLAVRDEVVPDESIGADVAPPEETPEEVAVVEIAVNDAPVTPAFVPEPEAIGRSAPTQPAYDPTSEVQLAMLSSIAYEAPADRALRSFLGDGMRGEAAAVSLEAWVPDHVAKSSTPQPRLYWDIEGSLPEAHRLGFVITAETETEPLYEGSLEVPARDGLQIVDLRRLGVSLVEDAVYRWTIFARAPSADPSEDRITQGWVRYRAMSDAFSENLLGASEVERAMRFAEKGYWYDALSLLVGLTEREPEDENVRQALSGFLASAGVARTRSIE